MDYLKVFFYFVFVFVFVEIANAATIHGIVYDESLNKVNSVIVSINTTPSQLMVANNGSYSFDVPNGFYILSAEFKQKNLLVASIEENITINQPGQYNLDLFLFSVIDEGIDYGNEPDWELNLLDSNLGNWSAIWIVLLVLSAFILISFYVYKTKYAKAIKPEQKKAQADVKFDGDDELEHLVNIIKNEGNRTTQKEIRKQIPLSEAKISLMIAELEHKGLIEKIKKGRGNIIILKKKE